MIVQSAALHAALRGSKDKCSNRHDSWTLSQEMAGEFLFFTTWLDRRISYDFHHGQMLVKCHTTSK